jgi:predicted nucleic acid-binding protein
MMKSLFYLDTSAIVPLFLKEESGHQKMNELYSKQNHGFVVSELAHLEFVSALRKKRDARQITEEQVERYRKAYAKKFIEAIQSNKVTYLPVESLIYELAPELILHHQLKTLDAIQLQVALVYQGLGLIFVTSDNKLAKVASKYFEMIHLNDFRVAGCET